jgi:GMP synthase-like glutamine amidotransferase
MSVKDEAQLVWLTAEKEFIHGRIAADIAALGVCLGHS